MFKLSLVGNLQNLDKVSFLCLIASLQSLYHGLLFFGLVEVFGMHFSLTSISDEVKSAIRSVESERDEVVKDSSKE